VSTGFGVDVKYFPCYPISMETTEEKRPRGRPSGQVYPYTKSLKLREEDQQRLRGLARKLDRDASWVIREAVRRMAEQEGVK
jgi:hypothetical protein